MQVIMNANINTQIISNVNNKQTHSKTQWHTLKHHFCETSTVGITKIK